ncbi:MULTISPECIES: ABC transporter permease [Pseudoramibacter]|uniref:ABC transporter permease n=1 Tax=Pseudoramibacter TaxID=113286 RepID=UPI002353E91F|nr:MULTISPECIES: ABC transporter permease [Pseudoramibacter]MBM6968805.1 ABC transporter permease [Pseudoramibacter alactolyticus]
MLKKRIFRNFRQHLPAYLALFVLIALGMYFIVSMIASADTVDLRMRANARRVHAEDGEITTLMPAGDRAVKALTAAGVSVEDQRYLDFKRGKATVRAFVKRSGINKITATKGRLPRRSDEIFLEQHFSEARGWRVGDDVTLAGETFRLVGVGCSPDYETPLKNLSDVSADSKNFGTAFFTKEGYEKLLATRRAVSAQSFTYAYRRHGKLSDQKVKRLFSANGAVVLSQTRAENNARIGEAVEDLSMNRVSGIVGGVILLTLIGFVISIFQANAVEKESAVIGALFAMGVNRKTMIRHYLTLPLIVTAFAGIAGTLLGFSKAGIGLQLSSTTGYYSLPLLPTVYSQYLFVYGIFVPPLIIVAVNGILLNRKLARSPLELLRHQRRVVKTSGLPLKRFDFNTRFMIRQLLREYKCRIAMIVGVFLSVLLLMMAMNIQVCVQNLVAQNRRDCTYRYMYVLKRQPKTQPKGSEAAYAKIYSCDAADGSHIEVTVLGIDRKSSYFRQIHTVKGQKVIASSSVAIKTQTKAGDILTLKDETTDDKVHYRIANVGSYSIGTTVFMDKQTLLKKEGQRPGTYNVLFSKKPLHLDHAIVASRMSRQDIRDFAATLQKNMRPLSAMTTIIAMVIFVAIIYLMMKFILDRSEFSISLMRIFGYSHREIRKLYMLCDLPIFVMALTVSTFAGKAIMDALWPMFVAHVSVGLDLTYQPRHYLMVMGFACLVYALVMAALSRYLRRKETQAVAVLKERE